VLEQLNALEEEDRSKDWSDSKISAWCNNRRTLKRRTEGTLGSVRVGRPLKRQRPAAALIVNKDQTLVGCCGELALLARGMADVDVQITAVRRAALVAGAAAAQEVERYLDTDSRKEFFRVFLGTMSDELYPASNREGDDN
jgi:hypothetical protein